jgi:MFS family permease
VQQRSSPRPAVQDWRLLVVVFTLTSLVEGIGMSQIFVLVPSYLREMGMAEAERLPFIGLFGSLAFIVGAPFVPLWGVWADKYSRKVIIVRSAVVEAVVLAAIALSAEPWQLAIAMMLKGLQLGNTGVMLAGIRDVVPRARLGTMIALFGASGAVGSAVGPALAGIFIDGLGWSIAAVFGFSAVLSLSTALLVTFGSREVRPEVIPAGRSLDLAFGAVRGVLSDPAVRRVFAIFGIAFLSIQMTRPYIPVLVEVVAGQGPGLASAIALVTGTAALVGSLVSPVVGAVGDRFGFRPVLLGTLVGSGIALALMPVAPSVPLLALAALAFAGLSTAVRAMVFALLATEVPPERRSATLNLVYLPLYGAGIVGPATGAVVVSAAGLAAPFTLGALIFVLGAAAIAFRSRRGDQPGTGSGAGPIRRSSAAARAATDDRGERPGR